MTRGTSGPGTTRLAAALALVVLTGWGCATSTPQIDEETARRARSHYDLGVDHLANGRTARGLSELLTAERLDPQNAEIQNALGGAYVRKGKLEDSERYFQRALALHPDFHNARLNLSTLYINLERYPEALAQAQILFDDPTFPQSWRALTNMGWAQFKLGQSDAARRNLEGALEYNGKYWPALLDLGILEAEQGRLLEAISRFQTLLELGPGPGAEAEANYRLGEIYVSLGKRERAVSYLTAAVMKAPGGRWGKKSEEYLKLLR